MFFNTICWILIGICCFYLLRNAYVGNIMFPIGKRIVGAFNDIQKNFHSFICPTPRNYYLLVLNPFWWRFLDIYKNDEAGRKIKLLWKEFCQDMKNLRKLQ